MATATAPTNADVDLEAFRARVREFLAANAKRRRDNKDDDDDAAELFADQGATDVVRAAKDFQSRLFDAGLAGITWPVEYGGQGLSNLHQQVFNEEAAAYDLPTGIFTIGHGMCAPTLLELGSDRLKDRYLRPLLRGDEIWCQLFSEPGAGSDVASLQARAVRDGEEWVLNGQKVWTSGAHYSDYGAVIARTDPEKPKHRGISMFVVDMKARGVTVKPLRQITGSANFNEVFFDDVRIPADHLVGEENDGWRAAIAMLMNERVAIGAGGGGPRRGGTFGSLARLARERGLIEDRRVRQDLADVYIRQTVLGYIGLRIRAALRSGRAPGPEGSIAKLSGALLARRSSDIGIALAGANGIAWGDSNPKADRWSLAVLNAPAGAIAGGSNEIQRNIIGERVLGLPKEPQVDRDPPFKDLKVGTQRTA